MSDLERAKSQAMSQFKSIVEMVSALRKAQRSNDIDCKCDDTEEAEQRIHEDALSVEVRKDWYSLGSESSGDNHPTDFRILLCTGGPAVQIRGTLSNHCEPESAWLEYQDWGTPWTRWTPGNSHNVENILLAYSRVFYFGE